MALADQHTADLDWIIPEHGVDTSYHTKGGAGATLSVKGIFESTGSEAEETEDGRRVTLLGRITYTRDAEAGVPSWTEADFLEIGSVRWEVLAAEEDEEDVLVLSLQRVSWVRRSGSRERRR